MKKRYCVIVEVSRYHGDSEQEKRTVFSSYHSSAAMASRRLAELINGKTRLGKATKRAAYSADREMQESQKPGYVRQRFFIRDDRTGLEHALIPFRKAFLS